MISADRNRTVKESSVKGFIFDALFVEQERAGGQNSWWLMADSSPQRRGGRWGSDILFPFCWEGQKGKNNLIWWIAVTGCIAVDVGASIFSLFIDPIRRFPCCFPSFSTENNKKDQTLRTLRLCGENIKLRRIMCMRQKCPGIADGWWADGW